MKKQVTLQFKDVLLVENLKCNLLSISEMEDKGCKMTIEQGKFTIIMGESEVTVGQRASSLYKLPFQIATKEECLLPNVEKLMHQRMGHVILAQMVCEN